MIKSFTLKIKNSINRLNKILFFIYSISVILLSSGCFVSCKSQKSITEANIEEVLIIKPGVNKNVKISEREKIIKEAHTWIGTPYKYGCQEKGFACDCSGMVMVVFEETTGIKLPRNSAKQSEFCSHIHKDEILPGDLVFFATGQDKKRVSHVGIMIDQVNFIHASSSKGVIISKMTTPYYQQNFLHYGRVIQLKKE